MGSYIKYVTNININNLILIIMSMKNGMINNGNFKVTTSRYGNQVVADKSWMSKKDESWRELLRK